jgi:hypothetical protein
VSLHFLVTSAIQTSHGIFTPQERFEQTMNTIGSIQKYEPTAGISIIEMSSEPVDEEFASKLQEHCEYYFDYNNDTNVKSIFEIFSYIFTTSQSALLLFYYFFFFSSIN